MRGLLLLGIGAFATGAAVAVVQQRRASVDDDYGEDPNWPSVPYTRETHPDSPQEQVVTTPAEPPEAPKPARAAESATDGAAKAGDAPGGDAAPTT